MNNIKMNKVESNDLIPRLLDSPSLAPAGLYLWVGPREIDQLVLYSLVSFMTPTSHFYWIDCGNRFDAYGMSQVARARKVDEKWVLSRIYLARVFTAIQLTAMLKKNVPKIPSGCPIILSDPMALFYDLEMPDTDARRAFRDFLHVVANLAVPVLALAVSRVPPPARRGFAKQLVRYANAVEYCKNKT